MDAPTCERRGLFSRRERTQSLTLWEGLGKNSGYLTGVPAGYRPRESVQAFE